MKTLFSLFLLSTCLAYSFGGQNPGENIKTRLYWSICEPSAEALHKKLALPIIKKFKSTNYYYETQSKDFFKSKYTLRLQKLNDKWSSDLKMDFDDPREIPDFIPPSMTCEKNYYPSEKFLACKIHFKKASQEKPISETQEDQIEEKFKKDIAAIKLESFGPFEGSVMKLKYQMQNKKNFTLEIHEVKGKKIDLSVRVGRVKDDVYFEELSKFLADKKVELCPNQKGERISL